VFRFWAYRARQDGAPIPRWLRNSAQWVDATLSLAEERDDILGRSVRVAHLIDARLADVFPPLIDAQLLSVDSERMVLSGLERDELTRKERAQTWVLHRGPKTAAGSTD